MKIGISDQFLKEDSQFPELYVEYFLASTWQDNWVNLICKRTGRPHTPPIKVSNEDNITEEEWARLTNGDKFIRIRK